MQYLVVGPTALSLKRMADIPGIPGRLFWDLEQSISRPVWLVVELPLLAEDGRCGHLSRQAARGGQRERNLFRKTASEGLHGAPGHRRKRPAAQLYVQIPYKKKKAIRRWPKSLNFWRARDDETGHWEEVVALA